EVAEKGRLPVPMFCAGGIATPADASLMMQLGAEGNFVGSGIFKSGDPERRAKAIVEATTHFNDPERVAAASIGLGEAMPGLEVHGIGDEPLRAVFIRAPRVARYGAGVEVLASYEGHPVAIREDGVLACAFHPELTDDPRLHALFMAMTTSFHEQREGEGAQR